MLLSIIKISTLIFNFHGFNSIHGLMNARSNTVFADA